MKFSRRLRMCAGQEESPSFLIRPSLECPCSGLAHFHFLPDDAINLLVVHQRHVNVKARRSSSACFAAYSCRL